ncbi:MAG: hypothetical protein JKY54_12010, partial [Flavobacteriales bacterium]|nr:hypothetical protein [Flavobacteriales bacterium]
MKLLKVNTFFKIENKIEFKAKVWKRLTPFLIAGILFPCIPLKSYGGTGGGGQAEFSSLNVNGNGNRVDPFSGQFNYSIPIFDLLGAAGGGYDMALNYSSGANPHGETSWVGYGWSLTPGAITRQVNGYPDDFKGDEVINWTYQPDNTSYTFSYGGGVAAYGTKMGMEAGRTGTSFGSSLSHVISYNSLTGIDIASSINFSSNIGKLGGFSTSISTDGDQEMDVNIHLNALQILDKILSKENSMAQSFGPGTISHTFSTRNPRPIPFQVPNVKTSTNYSIAVAAEFDPFTAATGVSVDGAFARSNVEFEPYEKLKAYGYLYSQEAQSIYVEQDAIAMDYSHEREFLNNEYTNLTYIPQPNYDEYFVSGSGMAGKFRAHHNKPISFLPKRQSTETDMADNIGASVSVHLGLNNGGGAGLSFVKSVSANSGYETPFEQEVPTSDENVFFRFSGENSSLLFDDNNTAVISNYGQGDQPYQTSLNNGERQPRAVYIGTHTNEVLAAVQANPQNDFRSYAKEQIVRANLLENELPGSGLGEFLVTNANGLSYEYGLPVYSKDELTISLDPKGDAIETLEGDIAFFNDVFCPNYNDLLLTNGEIDGRIKDGYNRVSGSAIESKYANAHLLTAVKAPNYIDRTNDGCTPDDFGGYTSFNYKSINEIEIDQGVNQGLRHQDAYFQWRSPFDGFRMNSNTTFKGTSDDSYSFASGKKEIYYLNTVNTKTHVAIFHTSTRDDGYEALDNNKAKKKINQEHLEKGGLQKLDYINIFSRQQLDGNNNILPGEKP